MQTTIFEGKRVRLQSDTSVAVLFFSNPPSGTMDALTERERARRLAEKPPRALAHVKRLIRSAWDRTMAIGFEEERTLICELMTSPRTIDQMAAMNQGRVHIATGD
jgi:hypothetical protein